MPQTFYFVEPEIGRNYSMNYGLKDAVVYDRKTGLQVKDDDGNPKTFSGKILTLVLFDRRSGMEIVVPLHEGIIPFFKMMIKEYENWVEKGKLPKLPKIKDLENLSDKKPKSYKYIG